MKLVRVCYGEFAGEERLSIRTLEVHPELIELFQALGVVEPKGDYITAEDLRRIQKALRLRCSLGVNLAGVAVILELLERIEALEDEIRTLKERQVRE